MYIWNQIYIQKIDIILPLAPFWKKACVQMSCDLPVLAFDWKKIVTRNRKEINKAKKSTKQCDQRCLPD